MLNCSVNDIVKLNTHHQNMEPIVLWKESFCELLIYIFTALYFISSMTNCDFLGLKSVISNWQISDVWFTAQLKLDQKQICLWVQTFLWNATSWSKPEVFNTPVSCLRCPWRSFMIETWKLLLFWHCSLPKSSIHTNEISMEIRKEISIKWCRAAAGNSCQVWSWSLLSNRALNGGEWHSHGVDGGCLWTNKAQSAARLRRIVRWLASTASASEKCLDSSRDVHVRERWGRELWRWLVKTHEQTTKWLLTVFRFF